jgi:hypothetical protein
LPGNRSDGGDEVRRRGWKTQHDLPTQDHSGGHRACDLAFGRGLSRIFTGKKKPRIVYEYDFGDSWQHEIVLEKTLEPEPKVRYPRCVEGERACPPEDCGGVWGYAEFLEAIGDPEHESQEEMLEWIGGEFDPEKFSVDKVNKELGEHH